MELANKKLAAVVIMAVVVAAAVAEGKNPATCYMSKEGLKACKLASRRKNPTDPSAGCCYALATTDSSCFCDLMKTYSKNKASGISFNRAKKIPGMCHVLSPVECA